MANIIPFLCVRPREDLVADISALPYDVYNREEAKKVVQEHPLSFLKIDRAETQFDDDVDIYSEQVYRKAAASLNEMMENGEFLKEENPFYYIYQLTMNHRKQTGIVACASIDDYLNNVIKKHENTRTDKEEDRIKHVEACAAQTGPIFLTYRANGVIKEVLHKVMQQDALYDFVAEDDVRHVVWKVDSTEDIQMISNEFQKISQIYIADGHHRAASAVKVGMKKRKENANYTGKEAFNYFLSVLFADDELMIMDYNRVVHDLNGQSEEAFFAEIGKRFSVKEYGTEIYQPRQKGEFGMYLHEKWYCLKKKEKMVSDNPVDSLDVSILQDEILEPVLGIKDPKVDERIHFVGGIRGLAELELQTQMYTDGVAFAMYPTSIGELFEVADAGLLMPPKSTWFEPKLRSGIFIHQI